MEAESLIYFDKYAPALFSHPQAFLGQLIFGEAQITLWWVGISLTFSGLLVLQRVSPQDGHQNAVAKRDE